MPTWVMDFEDIIDYIGSNCMPFKEEEYKPYSDLTIDQDMSFGHKGEETVRLMLQEGQKIEVKTERDVWKKTGNMAIEYKFKGEPSGIAHTKADWWFHNFVYQDKLVFTLVFKTDDLKEKIRSLWSSKIIRKIKGGDGNNSSLLLIPINKLIQ